MTTIGERDPEVAKALRQEDQRQRDSIVLIASENYASRAVLEVQSSVMNNKYAEGYPGRSYYGGCEYVDVVESLAIQRAGSYLAPNTSTSNLTAELKPIWPPISPYYNPATR